MGNAINYDEMTTAGYGNYPHAGGYGYGGGGGAFGGIFAMIILIVVVLWLLFKDGHRGHGDFDGMGRRGCGTCVEDESNWEENLRLDTKIDALGAAVIANQNKHFEIEQADKIACLRAEVNTLKVERDFDSRFGALSAQIACQFNQVERQLDHVPHKPPFVPTGRFAQPCFPRREEEEFCGC